MTFFKPEEFACNCCGQQKMDSHFVWLLEQLRERVGFPLVVTSGYRCPDHNCRVSKTGPNGPHTTGRAVDLKVAGEEAMTVLRAACRDGLFTGIGVKQHGVGRYLHLDNLPPDVGRPRPWIWSYP